MILAARRKMEAKVAAESALGNGAWAVKRDRGMYYFEVNGRVDLLWNGWGLERRSSSFMVMELWIERAVYVYFPPALFVYIFFELFVLSDIPTTRLSSCFLSRSSFYSLFFLLYLLSFSCQQGWELQCLAALVVISLGSFCSNWANTSEPRPCGYPHLRFLGLKMEFHIFPWLSFRVARGGH